MLLVVAHQDEDAFIESRIRRHILSGDSVFVVWTSYSKMPDNEYGNIQLREAAKAMKYLGLFPNSNISFSSIPTGRLCQSVGETVQLLGETDTLIEYA